MFTLKSRTMCYGLATVLTLAAVGFVSDQALAKTSVRNIGGTHSAGELQGKCSAAGGSYGTYSDGGYYCDNPGKGSVICDKNGKCKGYNPAIAGPPASPSGAKPIGNASGTVRSHSSVRHLPLKKVAARASGHAH